MRLAASAGRRGRHRRPDGHRQAGIALILALLLFAGGGLAHTGDHLLRSTVETAFGLPNLEGVPSEALGFAHRPAHGDDGNPFCPECLSRLQQTGSEGQAGDLAVAPATVERCPAPARERLVTLPRRAPASRGPPLSA